MLKKGLVCLLLMVATVACAPTDISQLKVPLLGSRISDDAEMLVVDIAPKMENCTGLIPMKCLVVDGDLFYDRIQGFRFQEGYYYKVKMAVEPAYPQGVVPADASPYKYTLVEVLSKSPHRK